MFSLFLIGDNKLDELISHPIFHYHFEAHSSHSGSKHKSISPASTHDIQNDKLSQ